MGRLRRSVHDRLTHEAVPAVGSAGCAPSSGRRCSPPSATVKAFPEALEAAGRAVVAEEVTVPQAVADVMAAAGEDRSVVL